jgi:hypothetical protein
LLRFSPWKSRSLLRLPDGGSSEPSLARKLFIEAQAATCSAPTAGTRDPAKLLGHYDAWRPHAFDCRSGTLLVAMPSLSEADRPLVLDSELESSMFRDPRAVLALLVFCAVIARTVVLLT